METLTAARPNLNDLPIEVILRICEHLTSKDIKNLSKVSQRFHDILKDNKLFKWWFNNTFDLYPIFPSEDDINWQAKYLIYTRQKELWNETDKFQRIVLKTGHSYKIDTVVLAQDARVCITGSRNRNLVLWNVEKCINSDEPIHPTIVRSEAHFGWIWDMDIFENTLYTVSWDHTARSWDLNSLLNPIVTFLCNFTALAVKSATNFLAVALCDKKVNLFDPRSGCLPYFTYESHNSAVISLDYMDNILVSGGEDSSLTIFDMRTHNILKKIKVKENITRALPIKVSIQNDGMFVVDGAGNLYLFDPNNFAKYNSWTISYEEKINSMTRTEECIMTCSKNGVIQPILPSDPPMFLNTHFSNNIGELSDVSMLNEVMAVSGSSGIELWTPRDHPFFTK